MASIFLSNSMSLTSIVTKIFHSFLAYHFQVRKVVLSSICFHMIAAYFINLSLQFCRR
ncbi:hypothetical protein HanIR_Chr01g0022781 [Helianthus annuus]|nr:hypothetical protein HanIR_Chr01g0022781 [Helianthus annuus]